MNTTLSAIGRARSWSLLRKLGEGDAGEVYLVESLLERKQAILKRPRRSAFSSDIIRQASQIENEGLILQVLNGLRPILPRKSELPKVNIRVPEFLDQSQPGTEFSDRFFIVVEIASGLDLNQIAKLARFGNIEFGQYFFKVWSIYRISCKEWSYRGVDPAAYDCRDFTNVRSNPHLLVN